jgi:hypothetical protein
VRNITWDDAPRYKKKSKAHPPRKADHKHEYASCVLDVENGWGVGNIKCRQFFTICSYCPVCGKIGGVIEPRYLVAGKWFEWSDEAMRELDPKTRTLPCFPVSDAWQKYVDLKGDGSK